MKIILLYGPGEAGKRTEALQLRKEFTPGAVTIVDLKQDGLDKLEAVISSIPLFETSARLLVVENAPEKLDLNKLPSGSEDLTLLILGGPLKQTSALLQSALKLKIKLYSFEGEKEFSIFPYLDYLLEGKKEAFLQLEKLLAEYEWVYILTMVYYGLRRNLLPLPASSYARGKIEVQKRRYKTEDWEKIYKLALETDFSIKSGKVPPDVGLTLLTLKITAGEYSV